MLRRTSSGFGLLALAGLLSDESYAAPTGAALQKTHFEPKVKNVIFAYMSGGLSHIDSFDPKRFWPPATTRPRGARRRTATR